MLRSGRGRYTSTVAQSEAAPRNEHDVESEIMMAQSEAPNHENDVESEITNTDAL